MSQIQLVKKHKKNSIVHLPPSAKNTPEMKLTSLAEFFGTFQKQYGDTSLIDENQHTVKLSDTCIAYDTNKRITYFRPLQTTLTLPFLCIDLFTHIENMALACAFFEEIPYVCDQDQT